MNYNEESDDYDSDEDNTVRKPMMKEKIESLRQLILNCDKNDTTSTIDNAISYLKTLQYEVQGGGIQ
ncbi:hypothetical protein CASFOL_011064 [Castilleja foliolosa]|uniref:BHLH domain-containing protein n=1 Tax=Castilleja foliolosa TaxID=1961234 RepID=A0ABD3DVG4_9LAMI